MQTTMQSLAKSTVPILTTMMTKAKANAMQDRWTMIEKVQPVVIAVVELASAQLILTINCLFVYALDTNFKN